MRAIMTLCKLLVVQVKHIITLRFSLMQLKPDIIKREYAIVYAMILQRNDNIRQTASRNKAEWKSRRFA